ncbi:flavin reductase [Microbacterium sp. NIBRBAC000506063]|uniref:flavin reductase n=1 Tax=Microbacterium sp. NIBRBAC000506063 TaxID=2734618 RepID=UPI001BB49772|nr:flavin reductase [Microbacterium sp. NIBRBAC000506063]QTV79078.1 flavin reductase [Microbacterium sp. NIBRBAC000506063]
MSAEQHAQPDLEPRRFRDVLGHFPTGVVVVTAMHPDGQAIAMVVGSFTSVSLDPPLVAFLPSRTSSSYARLRESPRFCVNVLSEEQEELCRRLAGRDPNKFDGVAWRRSPAGNPILAGAVAWIDCEATARHEAGDHDIVVGTVTALDTEEPAGPLLFFQGGYGRFDKVTEPAQTPAELSRSLQIAEVARPLLGALAARTGLDAYVQARLGGDLIIVGAVSGADRSVRGYLGQRLPLRVPYGAVFAAFDAGLEPRWTDAGAAGAAAAERLDRVRARGWSIGLVARNHDAHWETISRHHRHSGQEGWTPVSSQRSTASRVPMSPPQRCSSRAHSMCGSWQRR